MFISFMMALLLYTAPYCCTCVYYEGVNGNRTKSCILQFTSLTTNHIIQYYLELEDNGKVCIFVFVFTFWFGVLYSEN